MFHMNVLVWNCRGARNNNFRRALLDLVHQHTPDIVVLTETRMAGDRAQQIANTLPFDGFTCTPMRVSLGAFGCCGGLNEFEWTC